MEPVYHHRLRVDPEVLNEGGPSIMPKVSVHSIKPSQRGPPQGVNNPWMLRYLKIFSDYFILSLGVNDEILDQIGSLVGDRWGHLGSHLGFSEHELKALQVERISEFEKIITMLRRWRERHDYAEDRLKFLMSALRKCGLDNVADIYKKT